LKEVHEFALDDLRQRDTLTILRAVFTDPEGLRPGLTMENVGSLDQSTESELS
jgi:hypothetical protein